MDRAILHLDLDTFFVSVERLTDSSLIGKPVLVGGMSDRGVVASCSYEARKFGVHSGMPIRRARQLCPEAISVRTNFEAYTRYSRMVTGILRDAVPVLEKASIDEHYCDLTGMDKYFGCLKWSTALRQKIIKETGLPISFGLSSNKTVSKIATGQAKPNGQLCIEPGTEKAFLAPLPIKKIPMLGEKTQQMMQKRGIHTIGDLQMIPADKLVALLGENGMSLWRKANGIDKGQVIPYHERSSISKEETFNSDTTDLAQLQRVIVRMVDLLAYDLRREQKLTGCVTIKIRFSNFDTESKQAHLSYTAADRPLTEKALELLDKAYNRKMPVRLVGVKFSDLTTGGYQLNLFTDTLAQVTVGQAMDSIRNRFGVRSISKAAIIGDKRGLERGTH